MSEWTPITRLVFANGMLMTEGENVDYVWREDGVLVCHPKQSQFRQPCVIRVIDIHGTDVTREVQCLYPGWQKPMPIENDY